MYGNFKKMNDFLYYIIIKESNAKFNIKCNNGEQSNIVFVCDNISRDNKFYY